MVAVSIPAPDLNLNGWLTFSKTACYSAAMVYLKEIFKALNRAKVEYLVAGGVALNLHQIVRATVDLDLIVHLQKNNVLRFVSVLSKLGFKPKVPVKPEEFADKKKRESWILSKNMVVFSFINPNDPRELIDIFVREPKPFRQLYKNRKEIEAFGTAIPIVGVEDLIALKKEAGREKDRHDIKMLRKRYEGEEI